VAELARRLGAARALVPPDPGLLSAYGMLASPVTRELSRTVLASSEREDLDRLLQEVFVEMEERGRKEMADEGTDPAVLVAERWVDARYQGQSFELRVPAAGWIESFHAQHAERYGYRRDATPVEAVTLRVVVTAPAVPLDVPELAEASGAPPIASGRVYFGGRDLEASLVWRRDLAAGHKLEGPAIVQEYSATTWVPPHWRLEVDRWGCLHLISGA
jgi:N-methylhydantoinase A